MVADAQQETLPCLDQFAKFFAEKAGDQPRPVTVEQRAEHRVLQFGFELRAVEAVAGVAEGFPANRRAGAEAQLAEEGRRQRFRDRFEEHLEFRRWPFVVAWRALLLADRVEHARRWRRAVFLGVRVGERQVSERIVFELAGGVAEQTLFEAARGAFFVLLLGRSEW